MGRRRFGTVDIAGCGQRWATTEEAAEIVRCHPEVLRRWNREGSAPFGLPKPKRRGRQFIWDIAALHEAMESIPADDRGE
jgi:hypothetical protein